MTETITDLADRFGVTSDTLRYYERIGLLVPTGRSPAGYRQYDAEAADRLGFIRAAQRSGLQLADIKELLEISDQGGCPCGHTDEVVGRRLDEVSAQIAKLAALERQLLELRERNDECRRGAAREWACAVGLRKGGDDQ